MRKLKNIPFLYLVLALCCFSKQVAAQAGSSIRLTFANMVGSQPLVLDTVMYSNPFKETYNITRLKYYISHVKAVASAKIAAAEKNSYHLVDESDSSSLSFSFAVKAGRYNTLSFMLGVDSLKNVSGAQTGALDVTRGMFWTWNSGYIMMKLEGTSPVSTGPNNKVEYHIGGYSGPNSAIRTLDLAAPGGQPITVLPGKTTEIIIEADLSKWWQVPNDIRIAELPACMTPGPLSKKIADNYSKLFSVKQVIQH